jgi:hypothetical protein
MEWTVVRLLPVNSSNESESLEESGLDIQDFLVRSCNNKMAAIPNDRPLKRSPMVSIPILDEPGTSQPYEKGKSPKHETPTQARPRFHWSDALLDSS